MQAKFFCNGNKHEGCCSVSCVVLESAGEVASFGQLLAVELPGLQESFEVLHLLLMDPSLTPLLSFMLLQPVVEYIHDL